MKRGILILLLAKCLLVSGQPLRCELFYKMNSLATNTAPHDMSGNNRDSIVITTNLSIVTGIIDGGILSNSTEAKRILPKKGAFDSTYNNAVSFLFWIYNTGANGLEWIFASGAGGTQNRVCNIAKNNTNDIRITYSTNISKGTATATATNIAPTNIWTHIAVIFQANPTDGGVITFYKNGDIFSTTTISGSSFLQINYGNIISVLSSNTGGGNTFKGGLDQLEVYSGLMSPAYVKSKYMNQKFGL